MAAPETYLACLEELLGWTVSLRDAVDQEQWEQLLACLEERQALMDQIDAMPVARMMEEDLEVAMKLLGQISALDAETMPKVEAALTATREAIAAQQLTRKTIGAYRKAVHNNHPLASEARFVDKQR